jgi:hypothetical protein
MIGVTHHVNPYRVLTVGYSLVKIETQTAEGADTPGVSGHLPGVEPLVNPSRNRSGCKLGRWIMQRLLLATWLGLALAFVGVQGAGSVSAADQQSVYSKKPSLSLTVVAGTTCLSSIPTSCEYHNILRVTGSGLMPQSYVGEDLNGRVWDSAAFGPVSGDGTYDNQGNSGAYGFPCGEYGVQVTVTGISVVGSASGKVHRTVTATAILPC